VYGSPEYSTDNLPVLDPVKNTATTFHATVLDPKMPLSLGPGHAAALTAMQPSAYWGDEAIWDTRVNNHNSMVDGKGRVWLAASTRDEKTPRIACPARSPVRESVSDQGVAAAGRRVGSQGGQNTRANTCSMTELSIVRLRTTRRSAACIARLGIPHGGLPQRLLIGNAFADG